MSKTRNRSRRRQIIAICICGLGFSYGSAIGTLSTLFDNIIKTTEKSRPIDQIFDGKVSTDNLYKKALNMVKVETVTTVRDSIQDVVKAISEQSQSQINPQDIYYIVYDSAISSKKFAATEEFVNDTVKKEKSRGKSETEITASYGRLSQKINACTKYTGLEERACIKRRISKQYRAAEQNHVDQKSFKEQIYGEDLFSNGTTDDSDYDILIDIKNISKILFTSFISPTQTLFYKLPKSGTSAIKSTFSNIINALGNGEGTASTQSMGSFGEGSGSDGTTANNGTTNNTTTQTSNGNTNGTIDENDSSIAGFITKTNTTSTNTSTTNTTNTNTKLLGIAQGNICIPSVSAGNTETTSTNTTQATTTTIQEYLDQIDKQTSGTTAPVDYTNKDLLDGGSNDPDPTELARLNELVEAKINSIFDPVATQSCTNKCSENAKLKRQSCTDQSNTQKAVCNAMPYVDKVICNKNRLDNEATCKEPLIAEETMCTIECLCFTTVYPKSALGLEGMDGQLKLRFCSIPVQKNRISKGKDILGRDDSLTRIKSVFENLLNGGEMIKYERNKEYLDSPLGAIKWDKFISFDISIYLKGLFPSVSDKAKKEERKKATSKADTNSKGNPTSNETKNINKILTDTAISQAQKEVSTTYADFQNKIAIKTAELNQNSEKTFSDEILANSKNEKNIIFNEQIGEFLQKNSEIRSKITTELLSFKTLGKALNTAITNSK